MKKIYFPDTAAILDPCGDKVFKHIFTQDTPSSRGALSSLLSAFVGRKTQVLAVTANEPPVSNPQDRQIRYDIACKFEGGERADLEMTLYPRPHEAARLEYYLARLYINQDIKGTDKGFRNLQRTYQISFFVKKSLYPGRELIHHFRYYDRRHRIDLGGQTEIITVELEKAAGLLKKRAGALSPAESWACFFRYGPEVERRGLINEILAEEEGIAMAGEKLLTVSEDERFQAWQMSAEKYELDRQDDLTEARYAGYAEAEAKYQGQIRQVQGQLSLKDEQMRRMEEEIRRLKGQ
ncbi:MAG: Rpn family recombination-promoting nuclease/putative transposase [Treponema sp.]|jgi:predicted transposase/invertase (TIGR01784 family)|nr:Rpn family recombination-promoting nuclease/putative transposase [Treponema sp.]